MSATSRRPSSKRWRGSASAQGVSLTALSSVYRTPPWGKLDQPDFLNMAALVETTLPSRALLALCLEVERGLGRERRERWGPRLIDIDILTYGDATIDEPNLKVPHPRLTERAFALAPLAEIAPRLIVGGRTIADWLMRRRARRRRDRCGGERQARRRTRRPRRRCALARLAATSRPPPRTRALDHRLMAMIG